MKGRLAGVIVLLLLLGLAGVALVVVHFTGTERPGQHANVKASFPGDLLASNRTHLSLCVDRASAMAGSTPQEVAAAEVQRVEKAVRNALATLNPVPPEFGTPSVTVGCPPPIPLTGTRVSYLDLCCYLAKFVRDPAQLSPFRIFVYFVPDLVYTQSLGDEGAYVSTTAETSCQGGACGGMTGSIYAPDSITDNDLAQAVLKNLGLAPVTPEPTIDWANCARTPSPWCDRYFYCLTPTPAVSPIMCQNFWKKAGLTPPPR